MKFDVLEPLVLEGLSSYKIADRLGLSQTTIRYWLKKHSLSTRCPPNIHCDSCGTLLAGHRRKYCSDPCRHKTSNAKHQNYEAQKRRGLTRKLELIELCGGCCQECGYGANLAALEFHHDGEKDFQLDIRSPSNRTKESCLAELEKCTLLCANCHRELHHPECDTSL